eukprot:CAMPEP_0196588404 /NCGR_PEP_ID=MMETSP1081-20130531/60452_1 /TAXON_ID=36882 /ORGANISM="Pyramimonas amylifera, Strain CCMP720" /LENGTH=174 /DNA_ID=CAMNT_0041910887 /DNA_START=149 /DNA_END=673 /DNA_ORIENTATION=-
MIAILLQQMDIPVRNLVLIDGPPFGPVDTGPNPRVFSDFLTIKRLGKDPPTAMEFMTRVQRYQKVVTGENNDDELSPSPTEQHRPASISKKLWQNALATSYIKFEYCVKLANKHGTEELLENAMVSPVALLLASQNRRENIKTINQEQFGEKLEVFDVPGNHDSLLHEPQLSGM